MSELLRDQHRTIVSSRSRVRCLGNLGGEGGKKRSSSFQVRTEHAYLQEWDQLVSPLDLLPDDRQHLWVLSRQPDSWDPIDQKLAIQGKFVAAAPLGSTLFGL